jgi:hypothetical protein
MYHAGPFALWRKLAIRGKALSPAPGFLKPSAMRAFLFFQQNVDIFAKPVHCVNADLSPRRQCGSTVFVFFVFLYV